jgi:ATP-dependent DNA helicase RecG
LKIADIVKDNQILQTARYHAVQLLKNDPRLEKEENAPVLRAFTKMMTNKTIWNYIS